MINIINSSIIININTTTTNNNNNNSSGSTNRSDSRNHLYLSSSHLSYRVRKFFLSATTYHSLLQSSLFFGQEQFFKIGIGSNTV